MEVNAKVDSKELRRRYTQYCEDKGYKVLSDNNLGKELKRQGVDKFRKRSEGDRINEYKGIRLLSGSVHSVHSMSTV